MNKLPAIGLLIFLAIIGIAQAHGTSVSSESSVILGKYELAFSTVPDYPVTGVETEILLEVHDTSTGEEVSDLEMGIEIHDSAEREVFSEKAHEEEHGLYGTHYIFAEGGEYEVHASFERNGEVIEKEFSLRVNSWGLESVIQLLVSLGLILFLVAFIIRDYARKPKKRKRRR